jgi:CheY-like chemotaxis protein
MRVHTENTQPYIQAFAQVLAKDPMSLEHWNIVHVHPNMEKAKDTFEMELIASLQALKTEYKHADCDVVICYDHDVLLISRELDGRELMVLAMELMSGVHADIEHMAYGLPHQWRELVAVLSSKIMDIKALPPSDLEEDDSEWFGELASLNDVFAEACKRRTSRNPMHILLVEDDPITRKIASSVFKQDYAVITAKDAQDAIACYLSYAPDIVFLDINLPDVDGFRVLRKIIANDPDSYVVMFSGNSYLDNITRALSSGAQGFVPKPFNRERMKHYVTDCALTRNKHVV